MPRLQRGPHHAPESWRTLVTSLAHAALVRGVIVWQVIATTYRVACACVMVVSGVRDMGRTHPCVEGMQCNGLRT